MKLSTLNKGLVLHLPLDEASLRGATGLADKTPHSSHGVSANTPVFTTDRMGNNGRAMSFNGSTDYVDCGNDESLNITEKITLSTWAKFPSSQSQTFSSIVGKWETVGDHRAYWLTYGKGSGKVNFYLSPDGVSYAHHAEYTPSTFDVWVHIVGTYDGTTMRIYENEIEKGRMTTSITINPEPMKEVCIGGRKDAVDRLLDGSLADVRIYNRAISETERSMLHEMYRPKLAISTLQKGLVLDMPLTSKRYNAGNSTFSDLTPQENNGVNSGGDVDTDHTTFVAANSDCVRIPDSESLSPTTAITAMIWVKGGEQNSYLLAHYDASLVQRAFAITDTSTDKFNVYISANGQSLGGNFKNYQSSLIVFDNTWHLVGFTFDAGTLKLFVDGIEDTNPTKIKDGAITTIHDSTADIMVGSSLSSDTPASLFTGDLAKAKIWNRASTPAEWLQAYEKTKGKFL